MAKRLNRAQRRAQPRRQFSGMGLLMVAAAGAPALSPFAWIVIDEAGDFVRDDLDRFVTSKGSWTAETCPICGSTVNLEHHVERVHGTTDPVVRNV